MTYVQAARFRLPGGFKALLAPRGGLIGNRLGRKSSSVPLSTPPCRGERERERRTAWPPQRCSHRLLGRGFPRAARRPPGLSGMRLPPTPWGFPTPPPPPP